ncbi:MAG: tandem-95 repeat protein, partial [Deltaproteobacteria bacterium]|nr:tandem-95 repeat protein [Deltaproteobacteria bacterium]
TPPVATDDSFITSVGASLIVAAPGVLANDIDSDGNPLTAVLVDTVSHGNLVLNSNGSFTYTPIPGYIGSDSFTYKANDGQADSGLALAALTIKVGGTFGLDSGNSSYTESANVLDAMRFLNTAGTGTLTKLEILFNDTAFSGKVRLGVYADVNGVPGGLVLDAGEAVVADSWVSAIGLNFPVVGGEYYWLAFNLQDENAVVYQSGQLLDSHYWAYVSYGELPDQFNLSGSGANNNQYVMRATVVPSGNTSPMAVNDEYNVIAGATLTVGAPGILSNDIDPDGDPLSTILVSTVSHGQLTLSADGSFSYIPSIGYKGNDSFTYLVNDGFSDSNVATTLLTVTAPEAVLTAVGVDPVLVLGGTASAG